MREHVNQNRLLFERRQSSLDVKAFGRAAVAALAEAGYVIVLKEPTEAAIRAGQAKLDSKLTGGAWNIEADDVWRAMIDAATEPVPDNPARDL